MKVIPVLKSLTLVVLLVLSAGRADAAPLGTAFTYQGFLRLNGAPANGAYDMVFRLFQQGGAGPGLAVSNDSVAVTSGVFAVTLDFGAGVFDGTAYELDISVRDHSGGGPFVTLQPRQPLLATPNSIHAQTVGSVPDSALSSNVALLDKSAAFTVGISVTTLRVTDSTGGGALRFGPTDDCTIAVSPQGPAGLLLRDPQGVRILNPNTGPNRLLFGPTDDCTVSVSPTGPAGLLLRDPSGIRILSPDPVKPPTLRFGPTDDCSIGIDPAFPGLVERDPIGFRLLGRNNQGCRLIFGPTMDCTVEVDPAGPQGLLLRDPSGIRILTPDPTKPPTLRFGPTDDCSIGIDPVLSGLILRDPRGLRIAPTGQTALPRLLFGPTDDCSIGIDPAFPGLVERDPIGFRLLGRNNQGCRLIFGPTMDCTVEVDPAGPQGLLLRDPSGIRILTPDPMKPPVLRFGPTDDCSIGIDPAFPGLVERDPIGLRLLGRNNQGCRLIFGPTMDCTIEVQPMGIVGSLPGLLLRDPSGIRIVSPDPMKPPVLRFGPTDDCSIGIDPALSGLRLRDPGGLRIAPSAPAVPTLRFGPTDDCSIGIDPALPGLVVRDPSGLRIASPVPNAVPRLRFGPTDDCTIGIDPAFPGLVERDPIGLRLLGQTNQGGRLIFGPTMDCTVEVQPPGSNAIAGLLLRDPRGIRILNPTAGGTNTLLFGPTDDCRITASPSSIAGMRFTDPRGFTFGSQVTVNGPVFAQQFIQTSSRRFKDDVKPIEQPLEKISKLQGVRFTWNKEKGGQRDIGFIAEEVAKVIPEVVAWEEDGENARGVNYDHLVAVAIEGIKAQQSQIQSLEREKAQLKQSLDAMQARVERMSQQLETLMAR